MSKPELINELAPCGVFCGACPSFKKSCLGCSSNDKNQKRKSKWGCKIRDCCYNKKELDYCAYCEEFPCKIIHKKLLSSHKDDPAFKYRFEIPDNFIKLKEMGLDGYINYQKDRWKCSLCGGLIHFYYYRCSKCGVKS
jgi:hypothetical protein